MYNSESDYSADEKEFQDHPIQAMLLIAMAVSVLAVVNTYDFLAKMARKIKGIHPLSGHIHKDIIQRF
jgi:hypothetical protein